MRNLELILEGETGLSVRWFNVTEAISTPFTVSTWARTREHDLDLESIVGKPAAFRAAWREGGSRAWAGVCTHMQQLETETTGESLYQVVIEPKVALMAHRRNHRLFQHMSIPDIVEQLLGEWGIRRTLRIDKERFARLELRVQYGESDLAFTHRLLEEAGISYFFEHDPDPDESKLVLTDAPHAADARPGGAIPFVDHPNPTLGNDYVTNLSLARQLQPGKTTLRDHDFWRQPEFKLTATSKRGTSAEEQLEQYHYTPAAFLAGTGAQGSATEVLGGTPPPPGPAPPGSELLGGVTEHLAAALGGSGVPDMATRVGQLLASAAASASGQLAADDRGQVRFQEPQGQQRADALQESLHAARHRVSFATNAFDLAPGTVLSVDHPRRDLAPDRKILVLDFSFSGSVGDEWAASASATFANHPFRPMPHTPKPRIFGQQSAIVVGPEGEEVHTDERLGRVRVQFHWDREGTHDEKSSVWMRVTQPWAGAGYGFFAIPRVGQEVLVSFLEGDPDLPVVVGSLFNHTAPVPYKLPEHKTRTSLRSRSTPDSDGSNELTFEDAQGKELVYLHAERDLQVVARHDRAALVGDVDSVLVGTKHRTAVVPANGADRPPTHIEIADKRISFGTGEASITVDGADIVLRAKGKIRVVSSGDDIILRGGPFVKVNCPSADEADPGE